MIKKASEMSAQCSVDGCADISTHWRILCARHFNLLPIGEQERLRNAHQKVAMKRRGAKKRWARLVEGMVKVAYNCALLEQIRKIHRERNSDEEVNVKEHQGKIS